MDATVTLDVRNFRSAAGSGYTNIPASNARTYSYRFTGGPNNDGTITEITGTGQALITVHVQADPRYHITDITFGSNGANDLSWRSTFPPYLAVITDTNTDNIDSEYSVVILDTVANARVLCDPAIKNRPNK
ncbi:hypothetical protein Q4567_04905 [Aliiglaciecola sp. 2_MG-2023]|uniref:hypothetical protein n=1 Tax=Alteromonadaceae TaxID=72275 RepID=UPI0026E38BC1|nr:MULTISPECIES: hypothetical protein [unclassified Aliiglaciecola]MDO6710053.1 hypothetical protein [Aliiglaciecola sp. 2_MG-2023]MDO6751201.1 hypothetical protein [Aliiglaciecola sp. 1_MG-2023]